ncbi:MAG: DUF192 domain-containing protein [Planctomycetaceae bacterium]
MRCARLGPFDVEVPETRRERARGLLGRSGLAEGRGLLLERCRSVHTFGMGFPIDVVLLDRRWRVVRVVPMRPRRLLLPRLGVRHVLEVAEGAAPRPGLRLTSSPAGPGSRPTRGAPGSGRRGRT